MIRTPPKPVSIASDIPFLAGRARTTIRLHPRSGSPGSSSSSLGGPLYWPGAEPWPHCGHHDDPVAHVPALQLWGREMPLLPMPVGADLFQITWCPFDHDDADTAYGPKVNAFWRNSATMDDPVAGEPTTRSEDAEEDFIPHPCVLSPEPVEEYPSTFDLTPEEYDQAAEWRGVEGLSYSPNLGAAPGCKALGWPNWYEDPKFPLCERGHTTAYFLTIASWEYDSESARTWLPREDLERIRLDSPGRQPRLPHPGHGPLGVGLCLGDAGNMHVFVCR
jgi:hypothetical protein